MMFASLAEAAYKDDSSAEFSSYNLANYQHLYHDEANGHIAHNDTDMVISFRGTNPLHLDDWLADVNALPKRCDSGHVHMGFKLEVDKLMPQVMDAIRAAPGRDVWICGHSLGGAMSYQAAAEMVHAGICTPVIYTFGEPRSGSWDFNHGVRVEHHRFVNCNDIVPHLPPYWFGYAHSGTFHYITYKGDVIKPTVWQRAKDQFYARRRAWEKGELFSGIYDHSVSLYATKIKGYVQSNGK